MELTSLDLHFLAEELQYMVNSKINKIYQPNPESILLQIHVPAVGKKIVNILLPSLIFISDEKEAQPEAPSGFPMLLRKRLYNARIRQVSQHGFERVLTFRLEVAPEGNKAEYFLIIELFSKGNVILCDSGFKIISLLKEQALKNRPLQRGITYAYPKKKYSPLGIEPGQIAEMASNSRHDSIVKTIAIELSMGGANAEKVCEMAGIGKNISKINPDAAARLAEAIRMVLLEKQHGNYNSWAMSQWKAAEAAEESRVSPAVAKLERMMAIQMKNIQELESEIAENNQKADYLYLKYQEVSGFLNSIRDARKKMPWKQIEERLRKHKSVKSVDPSKGKVTLDL